jgi:hypothetical protein
MAIERSQIRDGMTVRSADGEKLGEVLTTDEQGFIVEKGFFVPRDYVVRYDDVAEVSGDAVRLSAGREALRGLGQRGGLPEVRTTVRAAREEEDEEGRRPQGIAGPGPGMPGGTPTLLAGPDVRGERGQGTGAARTVRRDPEEE